MKNVLMQSALVLSGLVGMVSCASKETKEDVRQVSNIGGVNYNVGSYECEDAKNNLQSQFTFGANKAAFNLKGEAITLNCENARYASPEDRALLKRQTSFADICSGTSKKGRVVAGTSNSMGAVQLTSVLVDDSGTTLASAILNCNSAQPKNKGW